MAIATVSEQHSPQGPVAMLGLVLSRLEAQTLYKLLLDYDIPNPCMDHLTQVFSDALQSMKRVSLPNNTEN